MKILVALKQVPARDSMLKIGADARWLDESDLNFEINEPDAYALEAALQLKEQQGGEVVVLCAGPDRASSSIREALAKGADRAIHIEEENLGAYDVLSLARLLAKAVSAEQPDLVLTGLQSDDLGSGQTGVVMAELLNLPHATIIMAVEVTAAGLRVKRELEGGWFQWISMPLPAAITIQSGINQLRYAALKGIMAAKKKEIKVVPAPAGLAAKQRIASIYLPQKSKETRMIAGSPAEAAKELVRVLREEARVF